MPAQAVLWKARSRSGSTLNSAHYIAAPFQGADAGDIRAANGATRHLLVCLVLVLVTDAYYLPLDWKLRPTMKLRMKRCKSKCSGGMAEKRQVLQRLLKCLTCLSFPTLGVSLFDHGIQELLGVGEHIGGDFKALFGCELQAVFIV